MISCELICNGKQWLIVWAFIIYRIFFPSKDYVKSTKELLGLYLLQSHMLYIILTRKKHLEINFFQFFNLKMTGDKNF